VGGAVVIGKIKFVKEGKGYAFVTPCARFFDFRANYHLFLPINDESLRSLGFFLPTPVRR
jgi:hypothetical protein